MTEVEQVQCSRCGGETRLAGEISRVGREPGQRIFRCVACDHVIWQRTPAPSPSPPPAFDRAANQPAMQQQQEQPQAPKEEED